MSTDHNSKLIASLYEQEDTYTATEIADEMVEIGDPIFIQPIYSAYKRFKKTTVSHYFVGDIGSFRTPEATEIMKTITQEGDEVEFIYCLMHFIKIEFQENWLTEKVLQLVATELISKNGDVYSLDTYFEYLLKVKPKIDIKTTLRNAFEDKDTKNAISALAFRVLLKEDSKENLKYYIENFDKIKGEKSEIILAKEIVGWNGTLITTLKEKILKDGSPYPKEIIEKEKKKEEEKKAEKEKNIEIRLNNGEILKEIVQLRIRINTSSNSDPRFNFSIFTPSELIYQQAEGAEDKQRLVGYSADLRSFVQELNKEKLRQHGLSFEQAQIFIPEIQNTELSINSLHLYLYSKKIDAGKDLLGLRKLNALLSELMHPDDNPEDLVKLLKENDLLELYKEERFQQLHRRLLEKYRDFLSKFFEIIKPGVTENQ